VVLENFTVFNDLFVSCTRLQHKRGSLAAADCTFITLSRHTLFFAIPVNLFWSKHGVFELIKLVKNLRNLEHSLGICHNSISILSFVADQSLGFFKVLKCWWVCFSIFKFKCLHNCIVVVLFSSAYSYLLLGSKSSFLPLIFSLLVFNLPGYLSLNLLSLSPYALFLVLFVQIHYQVFLLAVSAHSIMSL